MFVNSVVNKTQPPVTSYDDYKAQEISMQHTNLQTKNKSYTLAFSLVALLN